MEFNDMRVKKLLTHSSCILYIGFFKNNDEEHFYSLSNNGQLKEWLLNPDGSIILLETCYLLRPGSEYLDYIGFPPTENTANGHNIIISAINVADNLLFCGYEDGLVLVWNQERRNVVDLNTIKSWKRSRTIVKQKNHIINEISLKFFILLYKPFIIFFVNLIFSSLFAFLDSEFSSSFFSLISLSVFSSKLSFFSICKNK